MAKSDDKDLRRVLDPLGLRPTIGDRVKDAGRRAYNRMRGGRLQKTPPEKLSLFEERRTRFEQEIGRRDEWVKDSPKALAKREYAERAALARIKGFKPEKWIPAERPEKLIALRALEARLREMQGRTGSYRVEIGTRIKESGVTDHNTRTILINPKFIDRTKPKAAIAALFMQLHLAMQREAVKNPGAYAEHGMKSIEEWAERKNRQYSFSKKDAVGYATRQTDHLR